ncbi:single-pass membrane and coiled-coil domain-containing protein 3-like isoform X1 [Puntigrus tetrazona]|uniref:single-pass membrane and coiled-coil domain-containing protein 3-like isoform X1 n=1 Tax=Puntigrus tetrazona TaxID=1606681 RepID=UPI001C8907A6|nr:single-pass membrane and coiled-coil domain-containing protein 3-like isoform X1 [Puntigrus tetrazona]
MSWSDIFYPGNPERRERLIRKTQELRLLMKNNFRATNQLIEALKEHLGLFFRPVILNENATVKQNCDVIIGRIREIQVEVAKIDQRMKEKLEPTLYEKLKNMYLPDYEYKQFSSIISAVCGATGLASTFLVGWLITNGYILTNVALACGLLATGFMASVVVGVLFMGIDMIVSAILGSIERDQLESALAEYDRALKEFRPASEKYQDNITYVKVRLEITRRVGNYIHSFF